MGDGTQQSFLKAIKDLPLKATYLLILSINTGLDMGQREFQVAVRSVLSLVRTKPEWSQHILDLAISESDKGVVGIDIAGDILGITSVPNEGEIRNGIL